MLTPTKAHLLGPICPTLSIPLYVCGVRLSILHDLLSRPAAALRCCVAAGNGTGDGDVDCGWSEGGRIDGLYARLYRVELGFLSEVA